MGREAVEHLIARMAATTSTPAVKKRFSPGLVERESTGLAPDDK